MSKSQRSDAIAECLIDVDIRLTELGVSFLPLDETGIDPDAHFTPLEESIRALCEQLGYSWDKINDIATKRILKKEEYCPCCGAKQEHRD